MRPGKDKDDMGNGGLRPRKPSTELPATLLQPLLPPAASAPSTPDPDGETTPGNKARFKAQSSDILRCNVNLS